MTQIQLDIPEDLMHKVAIYSVVNSLHDKRVAICSILTKFFDNENKNSKESKK